MRFFVAKSASLNGENEKAGEAQQKMRSSVRIAAKNFFVPYLISRFILILPFRYNFGCVKFLFTAVDTERSLFVYRRAVVANSFFTWCSIKTSESSLSYGNRKDFFQVHYINNANNFQVFYNYCIDWFRNKNLILPLPTEGNFKQSVSQLFPPCKLFFNARFTIDAPLLFP